MLSLLVIKTHDIELLCSFYRLLGLTFQKEKHGKGPIHYSSENQGFVFEIYPLKSNNTADTTTRLGFNVPNLEETIKALEAHDLEIINPPKISKWGYRAVVKDFDGRSVELTEYPT